MSKERHDGDSTSSPPEYHVAELLGGLGVIPDVRMGELSSVRILPGRLIIRHTDGSRVDIDLKQATDCRAGKHCRAA